MLKLSNSLKCCWLKYQETTTTVINKEIEFPLTFSKVLAVQGIVEQLDADTSTSTSCSVGSVVALVGVIASYTVSSAIIRKTKNAMIYHYAVIGY